MKNGDYTLIKPPADYPGKLYRSRYAYQHRVNYWLKTGINPDSLDGVIHHANEVKRDNTHENLEHKTHIDHNQHHHARPAKILTCPQCGKEFPQKRRPKQTFCSRRCIGLYNFPAKPSKVRGPAC